MQTMRDADRLHARTLFHPALLPPELSGALSACQIHDDYVLFVADQVLYLWLMCDPVHEKPAALMFNICNVALTTNSSHDYFVFNSVGDLLVVRFHMDRLLPVEASVGLTVSDNGRDSDDPMITVLSESDLSAFGIDVRNCQMRFFDAYGVLVVSSELSPVLTVLAFDLVEGAWGFRASFIVDFSADMMSVQHFSIWGPKSEPYVVAAGHSNNVYLQSLDFLSTSDDITLKRSRHPTWITALSAPQPGADDHALQWAVTGDTTGCLCFWQLITLTAPTSRPEDEDAEVRNIADFPADHPTDPPADPSAQPAEPAEPAQQTEPMSKWKLVHTEKHLLGGCAVTEILVDGRRQAWVGDRAGRVTCVHFSLRSNVCYVAHQLSFFPAAMAVSRLALRDAPAQPPTVRVLSKDLRECVECRLGKSIASVRRTWPEPNVALLSAHSCVVDPMVTLQAKAPSLTTTRALQPTASVSLGAHGLPSYTLQACAVLPRARIVAVADWMSSILLYDLDTNALLHSITSPASDCTKLLGQDLDGDEGSAALLVAGFRGGQVLVYRIDLRASWQGADGDDASEFSLQSISADSWDSLGSDRPPPSLLTGSLRSLTDSLLSEEPGASLDLLDHLHEPDPQHGPGGSGSRPPGNLAATALPLPERPRTAGCAAVKIDCVIFHSLSVGALPISDLFLSSGGDCLVAVGQRRHLFQFEGVALGAAYSPRRQQLRVLQCRRSLSLPEMCTSISTLQTLPEEMSAPASPTRPRLLLVLQTGATVQILDGLSLTIVTQFSLEAAESLIAKDPGEGSSIRGVVMWDYSDAGAGGLGAARGLVGLCVRDLGSWVSFGDQCGFRFMAELRSQVLRRLGAQRLAGLDGLVWSVVGYCAQQSPIVMAWSHKFVLLLRMQISRDRGPMVMRVKLLHLNSAPPAAEGDKDGSDTFATSTQLFTGRVVHAEALPLMPGIRFHQVFIALSSGFSFVVKL